MSLPVSVLYISKVEEILSALALRFRRLALSTINLIFFSYILFQFDPSVNKDSNAVATPVSNSSTSITETQNGAANNVTVACSVPVSRPVALTTSAVSTPNASTETESTKSSNNSEEPKQPEVNAAKSGEESASATERVDNQNKEVDESKETQSENASQMTQGKEPLDEPEAGPPLSPTGSLNSESGESGTGV